MSNHIFMMPSMAAANAYLVVHSITEAVIKYSYYIEGGLTVSKKEEKTKVLLDEVTLPPQNPKAIYKHIDSILN